MREKINNNQPNGNSKNCQQYKHISKDFFLFEIKKQAQNKKEKAKNKKLQYHFMFLTNVRKSN
jgi:hypothetical protein